MALPLRDVTIVTKVLKSVFTRHQFGSLSERWVRKCSVLIVDKGSVTCFAVSQEAR